ncbi:unnamed protein product [Ranitomeya imitator]|uniref:Uncharacterized protein n=1 Tax=Ranitomeya imitator TaxID=111125 RepID=A0ABN9MDI2_9NEOB|nr:unnamed protein product [Ranitomeya imitator]
MPERPQYPPQLYDEIVVERRNLGQHGCFTPGENIVENTATHCTILPPYCSHNMANIHPPKQGCGVRPKLAPFLEEKLKFWEAKSIWRHHEAVDKTGAIPEHDDGMGAMQYGERGTGVSVSKYENPKSSPLYTPTPPPPKPGQEDQRMEPQVPRISATMTYETRYGWKKKLEGSNEKTQD